MLKVLSSSDQTCVMLFFVIIIIAICVSQPSILQKQTKNVFKDKNEHVSDIYVSLCVMGNMCTVSKEPVPATTSIGE